jgi:hypothetical protein
MRFKFDAFTKLCEQITIPLRGLALEFGRTIPEGFSPFHAFSTVDLPPSRLGNGKPRHSYAEEGGLYP